MKTFTRGTVLIHARSKAPHDENRLIDFTANVTPWETRVVKSQVSDSEDADYDFKLGQGTLCEVEEVTFTDGSHWEQPSPL